MVAKLSRKIQKMSSADWLGGTAAILWVASGIFALMAAGFGLLAWKSAREETRAKDTASDKYKRESTIAITDANTRASNALIKLAEAETKLEEVKKRQEPRSFDIQKFRTAVQGKSHCDIEIFCQPNDNEAWVLAMNISGALATSGWPSATAVPIPDNMIPDINKMFGREMPADEKQFFEKMYKSYPPVLRAGTGSVGDFGIFVVSNQDVMDDFRQNKLGWNTPQGVLINALNSVGLNASPGLANNELPDNKLRIVVASKP
jgi:hypothetical protein